MILDGSEAPVRIEAQALLSSEKLAPTAKLNKVDSMLIFNVSVPFCSSGCMVLKRMSLY